MMNPALDLPRTVTISDKDTPVSSGGDAGTTAAPANTATPAPATGGANATAAPAGGEVAATTTGGAPKGVTLQPNQNAGDTPEGQQRQGGIADFMLPLVLLGGLVLMFVFTARGRKKQQQKQEAMVAQLKEGDRIMLHSGKMVTIKEVDKDRIFVYVDRDNRIVEEYHRNAVAMREEDMAARGRA